MSDPIWLVGVQDDGPRGLTDAARAAVAGAELLCGGTRQLALFPDAPGERVAITSDLDGLAAAIAAARAAGRRVVVLASGDPLFYGVGAYLGRCFGPRTLRVLPHVSAVQLAFARLGEPWQDAAVLSAHGRPLARILGRATASARFAVLTDDVATPAAVARALLDAGVEDAAAAVCEHLGGADERVVRGRLSEIAAAAFARLNVLVVLRDPAAVRWGRPLVGQPDECYAHRAGMITKAEVRAVSLTRLGLGRPGVATVWDVGAGSGSVAIEAASLRPDALVYAVERDPAQLELLCANVRRYQAGNVRPVTGAAPAVLAGLPDPEAVFVGGSGGALLPVLDTALSRLRPGGRLVLNLVGLDHLATVRQRLQAAGWHADVTQVSVARAAPIAGDLRLAALNPVFVVGAERPS